jgi:hypothetical protein
MAGAFLPGSTALFLRQAGGFPGERGLVSVTDKSLTSAHVAEASRAFSKDVVAAQ